MRELKIYEFQAKNIEDTFRSLNNLLKAREKDTCLKRDIMQSWQMIKNVLDEKIDTHIPRD